MDRGKAAELADPAALVHHVATDTQGGVGARDPNPFLSLTVLTNYILINSKHCYTVVRHLLLEAMHLFLVASLTVTQVLQSLCSRLSFLDLASQPLRRCPTWLVKHEKPRAPKWAPM